MEWLDPWRERMTTGLLAGQLADGSFGCHPYRKWTGAHWRLVSLVELGLPPGHADGVAAAETVLNWIASPSESRVIAGRERRPDGGWNADSRADEALERLRALLRPDGRWRATGRRHWRPPGRSRETGVEAVDWGDASPILTVLAEELMSSRPAPSVARHERPIRAKMGRATT